MSGATKRIEEAGKALNEGLIKKAMLLTDSVKAEKAHAIVVDIAKKCVSDKENCNNLCKEGAAKLKDMITPTTDNNEGLEEMLAEEENRAPNTPLSQESPTAPPETPPPDKPTTEMSDEEMFNNCPDCHVAAAAVEFVKIAEKDECDGTEALAKLKPCVDDNMTTPEKWIKTMTEVTEKATCEKMKYGQVLGELAEYLASKGGVFLKNIDKEVEHA